MWTYFSGVACSGYHTFFKERHFDIIYLNAVTIAVFSIFVFLQVCVFYHSSLDLDSMFTLPVCIFPPRNSLF